MSWCEKISLETVPGLMTPGQRIAVGTRQPPSQFVSFSPRNGVAPPSGQLNSSAPLSVEYITMVLSAMPEFVELGEELPDLPVVLDHAVGIHAQAGLALGLLLQVRPDVHAGGVPPAEEGLVGLVLALDEVERARRDLLVHGLHALLGQRAGVFDLLRPVRIRPASATRRAARTSS